MTKQLDIALQNKINNETLEMNNKKKQQMQLDRQLAMQTEAEQVHEKGLMPDGKGGKVSLRDQWRQEVKQAIEQDVNSYHDWRAAILGLIKMYTSFASTNQQLLKENVYLPVKHLFLSIVGYPLKDAIVDALCGTPDVALPALVQHAEIDAEGRLSVDLARTDGGDVDDLTILFHNGVAAWLSDHGYIQDPQTKVFKNGDAVLTAERFNDLKRRPSVADSIKSYDDALNELSSNLSPRP